jgi:glycerol-3-phosphate cytidylyltransferase-like family protein
MMTTMERPKGLEDVRYVGDKRRQVVYDMDHCDRPELVQDVVATGSIATFGPDTLAEARNRGYRLSRHCHPPGDSVAE